MRIIPLTTGLKPVITAMDISLVVSVRQMSGYYTIIARSKSVPQAIGLIAVIIGCLTAL